MDEINTACYCLFWLVGGISPVKVDLYLVVLALLPHITYQIDIFYKKEMMKESKLKIWIDNFSENSCREKLMIILPFLISTLR